MWLKAFIIIIIIIFKVFFIIIFKAFFLLFLIFKLWKILKTKLVSSTLRTTVAVKLVYSPTRFV